MTVDIEKSFDPINRIFLIKVLKNMVLKNILLGGLKYYYKIKNHVSLTVELQQCTTNFKRVP